MWNLNGTITTPWFGEHFVEEYYKEDREFHFVLELREDIKDQVGSGTFVIDLEFNTSIEEGSNRAEHSKEDIPSNCEVTCNYIVTGS